MRLVVAEKPIVRVPKTKRKSIAGQIVLVLLAVQLLFFCSFSAIRLPTATANNLTNFARKEANTLLACVPYKWRTKLGSRFPTVPPETKPIRLTLYTPQCPVAIFLGYVLGYPLATLAAALYLLLGTVGPFFGVNPFAAGGGPDYYFQPGFGYLVGMIVATITVGKLSTLRTSVRQIAAVAGGLASVHLIGLVYLLSSCLVFNMLENAPHWLTWVFEHARNLSWYPLPYDALFAFLLIGMGFPVRHLVDMLTAPDISFKSRNDVLAQQRIEQLRH